MARREKYKTFRPYPDDPSDLDRLLPLRELVPISVEAAPLVLGRDALDQLGGRGLGRGPLGDELAMVALVLGLAQLAGQPRLLDEALADNGQVLGGGIDIAEMGDRQPLGLPGFDRADRVEPGLDVDVGWRRRRDDQVGVGNEDGGHVADERGAALLVQVADVVRGVAGRVRDPHPEHRLAP